MRIEHLGSTPVLVVDGVGPAVGVRSISELLSAAFSGGAGTVAISVGRLDPSFFELRSGVAGELAQRLANYHARLAVVGELPPEALESRSFASFVLEGNRGDGPWFLGSLDDLAARLAGRGAVVRR